MMVLRCLIYLISTASLFVYGYEFDCGSCTCYVGEDIHIAVCEYAGLSSLPVLPPDFAILLDSIHLRHNQISELDPTILHSWLSLDYFDLRNNPLDCVKLRNIDFGSMIVHTDCVDTTSDDVPVMPTNTTITEIPEDSISHTMAGVSADGTYLTTHFTPTYSHIIRGDNRRYTKC
jgi:hypothetical protein